LAAPQAQEKAEKGRVQFLPGVVGEQADALMLFNKRMRGADGGERSAEASKWARDE